MNYRGIITAVVLLTLFGCNNATEQYVLKVKLRHLDMASIYESNMVKDILFDAEELDKDSLRTASHELFLKGIDLIRNKKKRNEGIEQIKRSILIFPEAKSYYELGNALAESGNKKALEESLESYSVARSLEYKPVSYIYFRKAAVYNSLAEMDTERKELFRGEALFNLREAFQSGFNDTSIVNNDARLKSIVTGPEYRRLVINSSLMNKTAGASGMFKLFLESFPEPVASYSIVAEKVDNRANAENVNYEFESYIPEMQNASFGRDVSRDFYYVTRLKSNENYHAVIYSSVSFMGEDMQSVYTTLATYDNSGKSISRKMVSCQCSAEKIRTLDYKNNELILTDYKRNWEKPITEVSFEENKVRSLDKLSTATFTITETGEIIGKEVPKEFEDSKTAMNY